MTTLCERPRGRYGSDDVVQVCPSAPSQSSFKGIPAYAQLSGPRPLAQGASVSITAEAKNLSFRELGAVVPLSVRPTQPVLTVLHVLGVGAQDKVIRPDARRIVASVPDVQTIRNGFAVSQFPAPPMRQPLFALDEERPVPGTPPVSTPLPASVRLVDACPEIIRRSYTLAHIGSSHSGIGHAEGCLRSASAYLCPNSTSRLRQERGL